MPRPSFGLPLLLALSLCASLGAQGQTNGQNRSVRMWATVQNSPPSITLNWLSHSGPTGYTIYRKLKGGTSWGTAIGTASSSATQFADNAVSINTSYEYKVVRTTSSSGDGQGYVNSGIELAMVEDRGKIVLLVDNTFTTSLAAQLIQLEQDLEGEGWTVIRQDVSRTAPVTSIKSIITTAYNADPTRVKAVFLFGHVPVPRSGNLAPDGHGEHFGAWAADVYYGDVNGIWTDNSVNSTGASWSGNYNVPGDGKFDQTIIPSTVELQVGRVDLYDLPAFPQSETTLLSNYLTKLHQWKVKQLISVDRAVVDDNFTTYTDAFSQTGWRGFGPLVHPNNVFSGDYFTELNAQADLWSYGCGGGTWTSCSNVATTAQFASNSPKGIFTVLFGSYFGDFDYQNNLFRAALASGKTLTNMWAGYPNWFIHHMGMGETVGYSTMLTQNNGNGHYEPANPQPGRVHIALMGDPTLRMHIVAPPGNVQASSANGASTTVTWTASPEPGLLGYHVYRFNTTTQLWERRTTNAVAGLTYTDNTAGLSGQVRYMVRALKLQVSYSGSYYNLSMGAFGQITLNPTSTDCLGVVGGAAMPGTTCNDGNACTTGDLWSATCQCAGTLSPDSDGDGVCNALDGCPNDANKIAPGQCGCGNLEPGSPCNDGNAATIGDVIGANCVCAGLLVDCLGVTGGSALPGTACNDNNSATGNDTWSAQCQCIGQVIDCMGVPGGSSLPGSACNDGNAQTVSDTWTAGCQCIGTPVDCLGVPGGTALPGTACNDGNPNTGNDTWNASCQCIGQLVDCNGVPGGTAVLDLCGVCGGNNACVDVQVCYTLVGLPNPDSEEAENGNIYNNIGALDLVRDSEPNPWRGNQFVALRFTGVDVPAGATIVNAYVQFTSRGTSGIDPCNLNLSFQNADNAEPLYWTPFNFTARPRTTTIPWNPPLWPTANQSGTAQRTSNIALLMQLVVNRPGWTSGNAMAVFVQGIGRRSAWSWDLDHARAAKLCVAYALPPIDCQGVVGGPAVPGSACNDGDATTGNDTWNASCTCVGVPLDCAGVPGGSALPGTMCDDGDATTGDDQWSAGCVCIGLPIDCEGIPGGSAFPGTSCDDGNAGTTNDVWTAGCQCIGELIDCLGVPGGSALPGSPCDDGNILTGDDQWSVSCTCAGVPMDCLGVPGGSAVVGSPCDDDDATTGNDVWDAECACAGLLIDCLGVPGGASLPGTACDDGVVLTVDDLYNAACVCEGIPVDEDCEGVPFGPSQPGTPCDDGDPLTGEDTWTPTCTCIGSLIDCEGVAGGSAIAGTACDDGDPNTGDDIWSVDCTCAGLPLDCESVPGGAATVGSPCDDGDPNTGDDVWSNDCACAGLPLDCLGIPGGTNTIGTICDDGDPATGDDVWTAQCACIGLLIDCEGVPGGTSLSGSSCDDGDASTGNDEWSEDCTCAGLPIDCLGVPGGSATPGSPCDDDDAATGEDRWNSDCMCAGSLIDCAGVAGGSSFSGTACDDGDPATGDDQWTSDCECVGLVIDCLGIPGGPAQIGTPCNDGSIFTGDDQWTSTCECEGLLIDCEGVPGGPALTGVPCDDGDPVTVNDTWSDGCDCVGLTPDCVGIPGGPALPGTPCDDGNNATGNDTYSLDCACAGLVIDCLGTPGGPALPGSVCDDENPDTGNDGWTSGCICTGEAYDCAGVPGGLALPGTPCDDGNPNTVTDTWTSNCACVGQPLDCVGVVNGTAFIDGCGVCAGGTTGIAPNPDSDNDLALDCLDNCPDLPNMDQADFDVDGIGNLCDNCPWISNPGQEDDNLNGVGNVCDEVGIGEVSAAPLLHALPNPTLGIIRLSSIPSDAREVLVLDPLGALRQRMPIATVLDLSGLAQGTYTLVLVDATMRPLGRVRVVRF